MNNTLQFRTMNRYFLLGFSLVCIFLASCSKRELELDEADPTMVKAITESLIETSATSKSEKEILWEPGDEIAVFSGELSGKFVSTLKKKPSTAAVFKGELGLESWPEEMDIWAVYPYSEDAFFDGETITTTLPSVQITKDEVFGKDMNLAIARSNTSILQFYNVGGGLRFSVTEEGIKKVMFEGLNGEAISGKVKIGFNKDGLPEVQEVTRGSQFITLLPPEGQEAFEKDTWYYIVAIPGSLEKGYKLRFYKDTDYARNVYEKVVTIKRNYYRDLEKVDEGIEYESQTTHFPETKEEWLESLETTNGVIEKVSSLIDMAWNTGQIKEKSLLKEVGKVEDVISVQFNDARTSLAVMQSDSLWVNFSLISTGWDSSEQNKTRSDVEHFGKRYLSSTEESHNSETFRKGKALIMAPFLFQFNNQELIDKWINVLKNSHFDCIDYYPDKKASILRFLGDSLSKYDFIILDTHGGTGYRARYPKGTWVSEQTVIGSGTEYDESVVTNYLSSGILTAENIALNVPPKIKKSYLCMTTSFLDNASFNGTCVILQSCETSKILDNTSGGSMIQTFLDRGCSVVSGYDESIENKTGTLMTTLLLGTLWEGLSFKDASDYLKNWPILSDYCEKLKKHYRNEFGFIHLTPVQGLDDINHKLFNFRQKDADKSYHLRSPYAVLDKVYPVENGTAFSFTSNTHSSNAYFDYYDELAKFRIHMSHRATYDIYIDSTLTKAGLSADTPHSSPVIIDGLSSGHHSWYVVTHIIDDDNGQTLGYYKSDVKPFTITGEVVTVESISLDKTNLELPVGNTVTLKATILPSDVTNKNVTWSSSNTSVATVSSSGDVKGKAKGTAIITVKTEDGGKTATCSVTVTDSKIPVSGVSLNKTSLSMKVGETQTLTATVTPSNATDKSMKWSSSNTSVATVSSSGVVTAKKAGNATVTVKTNDGGKQATCSVTVKETTMGGDIEGTGENQWN